MNRVRIEGSGLEVQVIETLICKKKYGVGRLTRQIWLAGGICPAQPGGLFLVMVENGSSNTMTKVLFNWVLPSRIFITDEWRPNNCAAIISEMERHETVNRSNEFFLNDDIAQIK